MWTSPRGSYARGRRGRCPVRTRFKVVEEIVAGVLSCASSSHEKSMVMTKMVR